MDTAHRSRTRLFTAVIAAAALAQPALDVTDFRRLARAASSETAIAVGAAPEGREAAGAVPTPEQEELIQFGLSRFADHGLDLPQVSFEFYPTTADCDGRQGYYFPQRRTLWMCSMSKATMLHELAHAWTDINLDEAEMKAFAAWRGLAAWNDPDDPWEHRATEHAAEIIAWALLDEPDHARFVVTSDDEAPRPVFRLLTIEDSAVEALHDGFVRLTGMEPRFRSPVEWDSEALEAVWQAKMASATSPERRTPSTAVASETPSEIEVHDCADRVLLQKAGIAVAGC